ncbi:MAG: XdhC family protein [Anaeromyxobacteraceae bacterium]
MPTTPHSPAALRAVCERMIAALRAGAVPAVSPDELPCFTAEALAGDPNVRPAMLAGVLAALGPDDVPTLVRALMAIDRNERAWLGFKIVTDPAKATDSEDTDVVAFRGKGQGSADARSGLFVVVNPTLGRDAEIVFSRRYSQRDWLQIVDCTRGPHMHDEQYAGVYWKSAALFRQERVFLLGASPVAAQVARVAGMVDFLTVAVDDDPAYLNPERFPASERVLVPGWDRLPDLGIGPDDHVCVLTRGHMHDPEALVYAVRSGAGYVGMMGAAEKNARVFELAEQHVPRAQLEATHTPIGLRFGARTPVELAMSVVAELIQVRDHRRKARAQAAAQA